MIMTASITHGRSQPAVKAAVPSLVTKLARYAKLGPQDRLALSRALSLDIRNVSVRSMLEDNGRERKLAIVLDGWACCYRHLRNGQRHLVACYLAGDVCDLHSLTAPRRDTTIVLLAGARIARMSESAFAALATVHPAISRAFWLDAQIASSIEREWLVNLAKRNARERVAHLLAEFAFRAELVGGFTKGSIELPITQADFAGACGLTPSHANRVLRLLFEQDIVTWRNATLFVHNRPALEAIAGFSPDYLTPAVSRSVESRPNLRLPI